MVVLFMLGRTTERLYGSLRFLAIYLFTGLTSSIASVLTPAAAAVDRKRRREMCSCLRGMRTVMQAS